MTTRPHLKESRPEIQGSTERMWGTPVEDDLLAPWSHHSEREATWEREDRLRLEYPTFFPSTPESRDEILSSGGELSHP